MKISVSSTFEAMAWWRAMLVCVLMGWTGCGTPSGREASPVSAGVTLKVENRTDYVWLLVFTAESGARSESRIQRREQTVLRLNPGAYRIEQAAQEGGPGEERLRRVLNVNFEAGQTYEWPLLTLLSDGGGSSL